MVITFSVVLALMLILIRPLQRNPFFLIYFGLVIAIKNAGTKNHPAIAICSLNIISNESTLSNNNRIKIDIIILKPIFNIKYIITELNRF